MTHVTDSVSFVEISDPVVDRIGQIHQQNVDLEHLDVAGIIVVHCQIPHLHRHSALLPHRHPLPLPSRSTTNTRNVGGGAIRPRGNAHSFAATAAAVANVGVALYRNVDTAVKDVNGITVVSHERVQV